MEREFSSKIIQETTSLKQFPSFLSIGNFPVIKQTVTVCNILSIVQLGDTTNTRIKVDSFRVPHKVSNPYYLVLFLA